MKQKISEADIQTSCLDLLRLKGWFCMKISTTGIYVRKSDSYIKNPNRGCPDILAFKNGKCLAIEVKSKNGIQSSDQKTWQLNFENHGFDYHIIRSLDELQAIL